MLAAQVPPSRATRSSSEGSQAEEAHPAAAQHPARMASFPTPPSPFAAVQELPLLAEPAQSNQSNAQPGEGTPESAASGVPANSGSVSSGSAPLGGPQFRAEAAPAAAQAGRVRLEHLDTAYRRRQQSTSLADARGSTSSEMDGHAAASSAPVPESDAMASGADANVDMAYDTPHLPVVAGPSSPAVPFCPAPNRGFVEVHCHSCTPVHPLTFVCAPSVSCVLVCLTSSLHPCCRCSLWGVRLRISPSWIVYQRVAGQHVIGIQQQMELYIHSAHSVCDRQV